LVSFRVSLSFDSRFPTLARVLPLFATGKQKCVQFGREFGSDFHPRRGGLWTGSVHSRPQDLDDRAVQIAPVGHVILRTQEWDHLECEVTIALDAGAQLRASSRVGNRSSDATNRDSRTACV
jgi:hypothetical protein